MRYFLIVGEASGDLHASHLMKALRQCDPDAEFYFYGGDLMSEAGGIRMEHYKTMAYMGFIPVLLHLPTIMHNLSACKQAIQRLHPDVVILVDYPGFNLKIARFVRQHVGIPVFYYISPKIWAWKEHRIKNIRRDVDALFSILPFEVDFFEGKHHYPIHYVGNPTVDEVAHYRKNNTETHDEFCHSLNLPAESPVIALLAGSRQQEIKDNLPRMCRAAASYAEQGYSLVIAGAPSVEEEFYAQTLSALPDSLHSRVHIIQNQTFRLLSHAEAALVTSGTATLETALFDVPQVVCYYTAMGRLVSWLRRRLLKVPYISLVNLVCAEEVVPELVADGMTVENVRRHLGYILKDGPHRAAMLEGYARMRRRLGPTGAALRAASEMVRLLRDRQQFPDSLSFPRPPKSLAP